MGSGLSIQLDRAFAVAMGAIAEGTIEDLVQRGLIERLQSKQARAAHQGLVHLKEGVLGGGSDQGDGPVFHPGQ